jgi:hypothetical protein
MQQLHYKYQVPGISSKSTGITFLYSRFYQEKYVYRDFTVICFIVLYVHLPVHTVQYINNRFFLSIHATITTVLVERYNFFSCPGSFGLVTILLVQ